MTKTNLTTAKQYGVSYQQVYQCLQDHRGRTKREEELSAEDKLRIEIR